MLRFCLQVAMDETYLGTSHRRSEPSCAARSQTSIGYEEKASTARRTSADSSYVLLQYNALFLMKYQDLMPGMNRRVEATALGTLCRLLVWTISLARAVDQANSHILSSAAVCATHRAMRAIFAFVLLFSLAASARVGTELSHLSKKNTTEVEPENPPTELEKDPEVEEDVEKWNAAATLPEDLKSGVLLADFQKNPCCACSLNLHAVLPKWVNKMRFKYAGAKCEYGGSATRFCGNTCDGPLHNNVCWKREYRQGKKDQDREFEHGWACWEMVLFWRDWIGWAFLRLVESETCSIVHHFSTQGVLLQDPTHCHLQAFLRTTVASTTHVPEARA